MIFPFRRKRKSASEDKLSSKAADDEQQPSFKLEPIEPRLLLSADLGVGLDIRSEWTHESRQQSMVADVFEESILESGFGMESIYADLSDEKSPKSFSVSPQYYSLESVVLNDDVTARIGNNVENIDVDENVSEVTTVAVVNTSSGITTSYVLSGNDASLFIIDEATGVLSFLSPPDYESPLDNDEDNVYEVSVVATSAGNIESYEYLVSVKNQSPVSISAWGSESVLVNEPYTIGIDANEDVLSWTINWGDGTTETVAGTEISASHTYSAAGLTYDISVSATDADGTWLANPLLIASGDTIVQYDTMTGESTVFIDDLGGANDIVFGPDGFIYVSSLDNDSIQRFDPDTGDLDEDFSLSVNNPQKVAFGPDGNLYVGTSGNLLANDLGGVYRFDAETGEYLDKFADALFPQGMVFGPNGNLYVSNVLFGLVEYNGATGEAIGQVADEWSAFEFVFGPNGDLYATSDSDDDAINQYNGSTGEFIRQFVESESGGLDNPSDLQFGPDGNLYVTSYANDEILKFNGVTGEFIGDVANIDNPSAIKFTPQTQVTVTSNNAIPEIDPIDDKTAVTGSELTIQADGSDSDSAEGALTYSLNQEAIDAGMSIDASSGLFTWEPLEAQEGLSFSVVITVTNSESATASTSFTVEVLETNTPPTFSPEPTENWTIDEGETLTFELFGSDPDLPGDNLTFSLDSASVARGMTIVEADNGAIFFSWTATEEHGREAPYAVSITLSDGSTEPLSHATEVIEITVNETNSPPVFIQISDWVVNEGELLTVDASALDADQPEDNLTYSFAPTYTPASGMSVDAETGEFYWTPSEDEGGSSHNVVIRVTDGSESVDTAFTITVNEVNSPPQIDSVYTKVVDEGQELSFTVEPHDLDSPENTLTFSLDQTVDLQPGMSIDEAGNFSWTPSEGQGGSNYTVTISVSDGSARADTAFMITVNEVNSPPQIDPIGPLVIDEGQGVSFAVEAQDFDTPEDTLTFSLDQTVDLQPGMSIDEAGRFSWTPSEGQGGSTYTVTVTVSDGTESVDTAFTITVNEVNSPPHIDPIGPLVIDEGQGVSFAVEAQDFDTPEDTLTFSLDQTVDLQPGMSIDEAGRFSWTPSEGQGGSTYTVTVTVSDGTESVDTAFTITVNEVNSPPQIYPIGPLVVDEGATLSFDVITSDPDLPQQTLTYSLDEYSISLGMYIVETPESVAVSWTPTEEQGQEDPYEVTITVTDSGNESLSSTQTVSVYVNETNTLPTIKPIDNKSIDEGETLTVDVQADDFDVPENTLTYSLNQSALELGMVINSATGKITWTPTEAQGGVSEYVTVYVYDSVDGASSSSTSFWVAVGDVNHPPVVAQPETQTIEEGETLNYAVIADDPDIPVAPLVYSLDNASVELGMTIDASTGVVTWTPSDAQSGLAYTAQITVVESDRDGLSTTVNLVINVVDKNTSPSIAPIDDLVIEEGTVWSLAVSAADNDVPEDVLSYSLNTEAIGLGMSINASTGEITWETNESHGGRTVSVVVTVTDSGNGNLFAEEEFTVTVLETNSAPEIATIADQSVVEGSTLSITAVASDLDSPSQNLSFSLDDASLALGMTIDKDTGEFRWTPNESQGGRAPLVTITATDSGDGGLEGTASFTITVVDANESPVLTPIANQSINEGENLSLQASATDTDLPVESLVYSLDTDSIALGMTIDADTGEFSWTPAEDFGGSVAVVTISVTDSGGLADSTQFVIEVNDTNTAPVINNGNGAAVNTISIVENQSAVTSISVDDADVPINKLTYSISGGDDQDLFQVTDTGDLTFTIPPEYDSLLDANGDGIYEVTIQVSDGSATDSQTIRVVILESEELPIAAAVLAPVDPDPVEFELNTSLSTGQASQDQEKEQVENDENNESNGANKPTSTAGIDESYVVNRDPKVEVFEPTVVWSASVQRDAFLYDDAQEGTSRDAINHVTLIPQLNNTLTLSSLSAGNEAVVQLVNDENFRESLDRLKSVVTDQTIRVDTVVRSSAFFATGLSIGYVAWLVKGGLMATSLASSMPMWRVLDPIPVLSNLDDNESDEEDDDQSLSSIIETENEWDRNNEPGSAAQ